MNPLFKVRHSAIVSLEGSVTNTNTSFSVAVCGTACWNRFSMSRNFDLFRVRLPLLIRATQNTILTL